MSQCSLCHVSPWAQANAERGKQLLPMSLCYINLPFLIVSAAAQISAINPLWQSPFLWQSQRFSTRDICCPCEFSQAAINNGTMKPLKLLQLTLCNMTSRQIKTISQQEFSFLNIQVTHINSILGTVTNIHHHHTCPAGFPDFRSHVL